MTDPNDRAGTKTAEAAEPHKIEAVRTGLEKLRVRLLDITKRNNLISFRYGKSSLRVVDADLDAIYRELLDGKSLPFVHVPEPEPKSKPDEDSFVPPGEKPSPKQFAESLGWSTSFDLEYGQGQKDSLRVLQYQDNSEVMLRKIGAATKTALEESGINLLHLVFGFLEWRESDDSSKAQYAPLLVVPVELFAPKSRDESRFFRLQYKDEDLTTNLSLAEKMRKDFGLEIPEIEEGDSPQQYFQRLAPILERKRDWRICRHISLALLSFAKLLMYRDLDPANWSSDGLARHPRLLDLFAGDAYEGPATATEFDIDKEEIDRGVPPLIYEADSSQHSALIIVERGDNLVIEGPPGTGKSQTIINMIASFLARNKSVLFIAEKMAALDVVKRKLDDAGLGDFCLELHSHKANKVALLKSLEKRIQAQFSPPSTLRQKQGLLHAKRDELTKYVSLLNTPHAAIAKTPFELIWQRDALSKDVPSQLLGINAISLPKAHLWDFPDLQIRRDMVATYSAHLRRLADAGGSIRASDNPWAWLPDAELSLSNQEELLVNMSTVSAGYEQRISIIDELAHMFTHESTDVGKWLMEPTHGWIARVQTAETHEAKKSILYDLLAPLAAKDNASAVQRFLDALHEYRNLPAPPDPATLPGTGDLPDGRVLSQFFEHDKRLEELGLTDYSLASLCALAHVFSEAETHVTKAKRAAVEVASALGVGSTAFTLRHIGDLVSARQLLTQAPLHLAHLRGAIFAKDGLSHVLARGTKEANALLTKRDSLVQHFVLDNGRSVQELLEMALLLESTPWYARLGRKYREVSASYTAICTLPQKQTRAQKANSLRLLADFRSRCDAFSTGSEYRAWLGDNFAGIETAWEDLIVATLWHEKIYTVLPEHREHASTVRSALLNLPAMRLRSLLGSADGGTPESEELEHTLNLLTELHSRIPNLPFEYQDADIDTFVEAVRVMVAVSTELVRNLAPLELEDATNRHELHKSFADIAKTRAQREADIARVHSLRAAAIAKAGAMREELNTNAAAQAVLKEHYHGINTESDTIVRTLALVRGIEELCLPCALQRWLLSSEYVARFTRLQEWVRLYVENASAITAIEQSLTNLIGHTFPFAKCDSSASFNSARSEIVRCLDAAHLLPLLVDAGTAERQLRNSGLEYVLNLCKEGVVVCDGLSTAFEYLFCDSLVRRLFNEHPDLWRLSGTNQEEARSRFSSLDRDVTELNRLEIAARASGRHVPNGWRGSSVKDLTDKQLILHEISKQRNHIAIRQLMARAGNAIQGLKPCFMMSPMSVAQFLAPGGMSFDLVVMDEASQLRPEDALGAIARGKQLVVVGDPKQLPPTSFFQRTLEDEDEDTDEMSAVAEGESILDIAWGCYQPVRRLRWHYRSQHESLIRFSNQEFYDGDLVVFPSAYESHPELGVKYIPVTNGVFENRRNPAEAARVVDAILEHIKRCPAESLGVVTMNFEQRELIEELLDKRLKEDSFSNAWIESGEGTPTEFFIKNLENVQGDERDVIFISVTYGLDAQGNYFQRLSGVNSKSGHRRLNVLITRAKRRTVVFSSLDPDLIRDEPGTPWGVRALKGYLRFAMSGITARPEISAGAETANEHEAAVGYVLKSHGYDVVPQVGVSGYFIDLAVRHPTKAGAFLLGVEFDGKSYHSGRSARDRDRLRQMTLENQGWKIHRIWSTDWFKNRNSEIERLLSRVRSLEGQRSGTV